MKSEINRLNLMLQTIASQLRANDLQTSVEGLCHQNGVRPLI